MKLDKVTLPNYTPGEEILNAISHGAGILLGIVSCILCLLKVSDTHSAVGSVVFALSAVVLYTCSTVYHSLKRGDAKKVMRILDHSTIFILITGTSIAVTIIFVFPFAKLFAIIMCSISALLSSVGTVLTFIDQEKYKKVQLILYIVVGWISAVLVFPMYKYAPDPSGLIIPLAVGGILYSVGMVFYIIGKKKKYFHFIFHLFVLAGTLFHFISIYTYI